MSNFTGLPQDFDYNVYRSYNDLLTLDNESLRIHYISYGSNEGRLYKLPYNFNVEIYKKLNKDLKKLNNNELLSHFVNIGFNEGRKYSKKLNDDSVFNINNVNPIKTNGTSRSDIVIVVARYNEDISSFIPYNNNLMVYNKGVNDINPAINQKYVKIVPNLGREAGTYCNFILDNYENLPNYMIFTQANPADHVAFGNNEDTFKVLDKIFHEEKNYKFKYISSHKEPFDLDSVAHIGLGVYLTPIELGEAKDVNQLIYNIQHWVSVMCPNQTERSNEVINALRNTGKSTIWPWEFNKILMKTGWYCTSGEAQKMRHEITKCDFDYGKIRRLIDRPEGFSFGYGAIFIVHKDNVLKYSKDYWKRLYDSLQELLPASGWGCERLWGFLLGEGDFY